MQDNSGNVVKQLGLSLNMVRRNVEEEDVEGISNHVRLMVAVCSPYVDDVEEYRLPRGDETDQQVFDACMAVVEALLREMAKKGIYAWNVEAPGDATGLALRDFDG